ncbi:hypothetical protein QTP88_002458 [Uroleucon formosanum]
MIQNCTHISNIEFDGCNSINNEALGQLNILKDYLKNLKINNCGIKISGVEKCKMFKRAKNNDWSSENQVARMQCTIL